VRGNSTGNGGYNDNIQPMRFNAQEDNSLTLKPQPVEAPKNISPEKIKQREGEQKAADQERAKIEAMIEVERQAALDAQ